MPASRRNCCILGCNNTSRQERGFGVEVKFYKFPESMLGASWKILKRKQWMNAVKNYVENPKDWVPNKYTRICSTHFVNNKKSEHPLHPSYVPSIFLGRENIKRNIQSLKRFQRARNRETNTIHIDKYIVSEKERNNINIDNTMDTVMEQGNEEHASRVEEHPIDIHVETVTVKPVQRSISCQTEIVTDGAYEDLVYFFCNLNYSNDLNTAAVQVNIPIKKTQNKICEAKIPIIKNVKDSSCDPINIDLSKSCQGFHGLSSITTDEAMSSLTGVTLAIFSWLLTMLPDCKASKVDKKTSFLITLVKLKTGLSFTALAVIFNIHRITAHRIFVKHIQQLNILLQNTKNNGRVQVYEVLSRAGFIYL
ncbi:Protein of unknown function [Cotesia congregata]|uniref:THAP-type domain-containing protein n=1 Tax=Cotesia congregata TaxID=51543 RepID=A0A8J2EI53_COTCN|nr:Protein of unknown function [Cotesia congregata]